MQLDQEFLEVQNYIRCIFYHARNSGELVRMPSMRRRSPLFWEDESGILQAVPKCDAVSSPSGSTTNLP